MPEPPHAESRSDAELVRINRGFYESLWAQAKLIAPERFNTWPLLHELADAAPRRLEVGSWIVVLRVVSCHAKRSPPRSCSRGGDVRT